MSAVNREVVKRRPRQKAPMPPSLEGRRLVLLPVVSDLLQYSSGHVRLLVRQKRFPQPVRLGPLGRFAWPIEVIEAFLRGEMPAVGGADAAGERGESKDHGPAGDIAAPALGTAEDPIEA